MSSASFKCSSCHELTSVPLSRLVRAQALRCETCYSISSLLDRQRDAMAAPTKRDKSSLAKAIPRRDDHVPR
jgi:hypothetical protein